MKIIRLIADTIQGNTFIPFTRYPAKENDRADALIDYAKWSNNPTYKNWRIELCNGEIIDDELIINKIMKTWNL